MTLKGKEQPPDSGIRAEITAHGKTVREETESLNVPRDEFGERLDKVELLIEELGQHTKYLDAFNDFVTEAKSDIWWLKVIRVAQ